MSFASREDSRRNQMSRARLRALSYKGYVLPVFACTDVSEQSANGFDMTSS